MVDQTPAPEPEVDEPPLQPAPTEPVTVASSVPSPTTAVPRRRRWLIALVAVAVLASATVAAAVLLVGAGTDSTVAPWAPADATMYAEVRADLPGDQRAALGEFLSAFPGFADQASLDTKLTELYDRLLAAATDGKQSYTSDVAPWFGGQLGVAVGPLPAIDSLDDPTDVTGQLRMLAIASVTDPVAATAWVRSTVSAAGATVRTADADGTELLLIGTDEHPVAAAASDQVLLLGDEVSVRAALARAGKDGLATVAAYDDAMRALEGQQAATYYLDPAAYVDWLLRSPALNGQIGTSADLADLLPEWAAGGLRIEPDALVATTVAPRASDAPDTANTRSELPSRLPASTAVLVDVHDAGAAILTSWTTSLADLPDAQRTQLEEALRVVGGIDALVGWAGETGLVVIADGTTPQAGLVIIPTDPTAAANLARAVRNLATVAGATVVDADHDGTTVTSVDLSGLDDLGPGVGSSHLHLSYAVTDDLVVIGYDALFVEAVLDTPDGDSLADQARFTDLLDRAGASHRLLVYADLDAIEAMAVAHLDPGERARFETDVQPYLAPLDAIVGVAVRDGSFERTRGLLVLDEGN
jgi:hypothetical protein